MVQDGSRGLALLQTHLGGVGVGLISFEKSDRSVGEGGIVRTSVSGVTGEAVTTSSGGGMMEAGACSGCGMEGPWRLWGVSW